MKNTNLMLPFDTPTPHPTPVLQNNTKTKILVKKLLFSGDISTGKTCRAIEIKLFFVRCDFCRKQD